MKKGSTLFIAVAMLLLAAMPCYGATAASCTTPALTGFPNSPALLVTFVCTASSTDGSFVSSTISDSRIKGMYISHVYTTPGTPNPQALWDATLKSTGGMDYMGGAVLNASATAQQRWVPLYTTGVYDQPVVKDTLIWAITGSNVGSAVITADVWLWRQ